jgi:hypothetical protein
MIRALRLVAVIAPVLGLAALWFQSDRTYHTGTEWEVPIMGYDPRDYLRGHYVEFQYDWPGGVAPGDIPNSGLCLEGKAPDIAKVMALKDGQACDHPVRAGRDGVYGSDGLFTGRLYIGQARASALEEQLRGRDQRGIVTIRQREDGSFTPVAIRFRPLTPQERAERDAQGAEDLRPPPPIMSQ